MPKRLKMNLGGQKWHRATTPSTREFWATRSFIATGEERFPLGNAYFIDSQGFRQYCIRFQPGLMIFIDPEKTPGAYPQEKSIRTKTGRELLERFYELKLKPLAFKWVKARTALETTHWICVYPAHYLVMVELSTSKKYHAKDHLASLYFRTDTGLIQIAEQDYEGHLRGNEDYDQPSILQSELREWRLQRLWFQDAMTSEQVFNLI